MSTKVKALLWEELRVGGSIAGSCALLGLIAQVSIAYLTNGGSPSSLRWHHVDTIVLMVTLGVPLDRKAERNVYRAALIELERAGRRYSQTRDQVALEVRRAHRRIELERNSLRIQEITLQSAERRVENANIRVELGEVSNREVVDAEKALLQARNRLARAISNLAISILEFARDAGTLRVDENGYWRPPPRRPGGQAEP